MGGRSYTVRKQYQDAVERKKWNALCLSSNGEYICAASAKRSVTIYIWQRCYERSLEKVLKTNDAKDTFVVDMVWHPIEPILICVTQCGDILVWNQNWRETGENWSTFDQNFEILSENAWVKEAEQSEEAALDLNDESAQIDIFREDGHFEDFFSADEDEKDWLNEADSLKLELIHLPIHNGLKCKYSPNEIVDFLEQVKKQTNEFVNAANREQKTIKISNKNEKVLHNLTHCLPNMNGRNATQKKKRKKKEKTKREKEEMQLKNANSYNSLKMNNRVLPKKRSFANQNDSKQNVAKNQKN